jgi:prenyltransferase beta subunit
MAVASHRHAEPGQPAVSAKSEKIMRSGNRARAFLRGAARPDGLFEDFVTLAGPSVDWVSGFVLACQGAAATSFDDPADSTWRRAVVVLTRRQRANGGWAYSERVPTDADSTAWGLSALAETVCWKPSTILRAARYLARHQNTDGGFSTYHPDDQISRYIEADDSQVAGWCQPHVSVTAAATTALLSVGASPACGRLQRAVHYLRQARAADGCWRCYWWRGEAYPTSLVTHALLRASALSTDDRHGIVDTLVQTQRADGGWADDSQSTEGDPWATACALITLLMVNTPGRPAMAARDAAVEFLLRTQRTDGSWTSGPILRIPRPIATSTGELDEWRVDALGTGVLVTPRNGCFVTAQVCRTLALAARRTC